MLADYGMTGAPAGGDPLDRVSARPDFQILVFPGPAAVRGAARGAALALGRLPARARGDRVLGTRRASAPPPAAIHARRRRLA